MKLRGILGLIVLAAVLGAGVFIGNRFGSAHPPATQPTPAETAKAGAPASLSMAPPAGLAAAMQAASTQPAATQPRGRGRPAQDQEMTSIAFRDVPVEQLFVFIADKTGKPVIPQDSIRQKRITVVGSKQLPLSEAMILIQEALRENGIVEEESPGVINMRPLAEAKQSTLRFVPANQSVKEIKNKAEVVHKIIELKYFDVVKMKDVVLPMLPDFGHVIAEPNTRQLMVTDTVGDLERIELLVASLDVPQADQTIKKIIPVKHGDASDIVATVRVLISNSLGSQARDISMGSGAAGPSGPGGGRGVGGPGGGADDVAAAAGPEMPGPRGAQRRGGGGGASAAFVEENKAPVVLLADTTHNWIVAVAPQRVMEFIEEWVAKLDVAPANEEALFDMIEVKFADVNEAASQINLTLDSLLSGDARQSVRVVSFPQSRKILVSGSRHGREMVKGLVAQLDQQAGSQVMRVFPLKYADAEDIASDIDQLYNGKKENSSYYDYFSPRRNQQVSQRVKVTADTRRNAVVIVSDGAMLDQIDKLLREQWDLPLSASESEPKIYALKFADAAKLKEKLEDLFGNEKKKTSQSSSPYYYDELLSLAQADKAAPIGRLYGQFKFEAMADSNRLLVIAKNPAYYGVIDRLIQQLDQPDDAGIPEMIELKHANAEDLAEQLNSALAEPGTLAQLLRASRDLSPAAGQTGLAASPLSGNTPSGNQANNNQQQSGNDNSNLMPFWWQRSRPNADEKPTSNLIGKIRFVPITRRNALLVVSPMAYMAPLRQLIADLDRPGAQVMIHVVIADVQHNDATTLGIRLASDPSVFNDPRLQDGAIRGAAGLNVANTYLGSLFGGTQNSSQTVFNGSLNLNVLIQLLIRKYGLKILYEPKLYTADNQEAEFFDGQDVPYQTNSQTSPEGTSVVSSFNYTAVGTRLRIRPHITKEDDVDLTVNVTLSDIVSGQTLFGNFIFDRRETTTHVIMHNGQTIMLSGIVQEETLKDVRKVPLLGDLPLLGPIFRSTDTSKQNRELVAFITPYVIHRDDRPPAAEGYKRWIDNLRNNMSSPTPPVGLPTSQP